MSIKSVQIEDVFTSRYAKENGCAPLTFESGSLTVLAVSPSDIYLRRHLESVLQCRVDLKQGSKEEVNEAFTRFQSSVDQLAGISESFRSEQYANAELDEEVDDESTGPIVRLINTIIKTALKKRVSDIHIECQAKSVFIKYRIDGVLYDATEELDATYKLSLVSRLKVMAELDITETRVPQDGRFKMAIGSMQVDFRISVIPSLYGENIVVRVLDNTYQRSKNRALTLNDMGFNPTQMEAFVRAISEPHGMVLITGPTGSGKTTTLYAAIDHINTGYQKIITIEDPVEYQLDGIMQIPVNNAKGLTFAKGLRSILRHDPDKILVGEIRDKETAEIALQSALTGHLVFSSVHANSAQDVLIRLSNIGVNLSNCLSALNCVVSQRLLRRVCEHCAVEVTYSEEELKTADLSPAELESANFKAGIGCEKCSDTGYHGRIMVCEVLMVQEFVQKARSEERDELSALSRNPVVNGITLRRAAVAALIRGDVTLDEVNRVTFN
jgi:type IV pilus assembly protein PilB